MVVKLYSEKIIHPSWCDEEPSLYIKSLDQFLGPWWNVSLLGRLLSKSGFKARGLERDQRIMYSKVALQMENSHGKGNSWHSTESEFLFFIWHKWNKITFKTASLTFPVIHFCCCKKKKIEPKYIGFTCLKDIYWITTSASVKMDLALWYNLWMQIQLSAPHF